MKHFLWIHFSQALFFAVALGIAQVPSSSAQDADLVLLHGRIATVDDAFSMASALAVRDGRILAVGTDEAVLRHRGPATKVADLQGRFVIPGLMDSHSHPVGAALTEFERTIPTMERISDVLDYIAEQARTLPEGQWIVLRQVFITRLDEQRYPTRAELDRAAPKHPVMFATGPDASLNTLALERSGIGRDFVVTDGGSGFAEKHPETGELTGILRNCTRYVKADPPSRRPSIEEKVRRLTELFADYNRVGLTTVCDRDADLSELEVLQALRQAGGQTVRVRVSRHVESIGPMAGVIQSIRDVAEDPLFREPDDWLAIIGVKTFLDGGMLTGSAYMRQPWGVSDIYAIRDPAYRGVRFIPHERLVPMIRAAAGAGLQFTAHAVGDGAVHALLDAYAEVGRELPLAKTRPCISHSNFMSREAVEQAARLGVAVDIQPAWLHLDTRTLARQFGYDRLRYFQPLRSLFEAGAVAGGGSDHMQKIGARRSINFYDPFLGMATAVTRRARGYSRELHPEEALNREQVLRFYTLNNARILRCDDRLGSLEPGKLADFVVLDTDLLTCRADAIERTQVLRTYVGGRLVWERAP
ncbi:MAG: amidohydrolase [Limisphaerales bacterium]